MEKLIRGSEAAELRGGRCQGVRMSCHRLCFALTNGEAPRAGQVAAIPVITGWICQRRRCFRLDVGQNVDSKVCALRGPLPQTLLSVRGFIRGSLLKYIVKVIWRE